MMHRQPPSLQHSTVVDRAIESEPLVYVRLNDGIDSAQDIKLNNNNDQHTLTSYKMPGLLDAAVSLADEDGFLPAYSTVPYTTSHQVRSITSFRFPISFYCHLRIFKKYNYLFLVYHRRPI